MNIQVMRFEGRKQLQSALLRHIDGRSRPDEARARPGLDPVVRLVHDLDGAREALRSAKAKKRRGRPGTTEAVEFFFGGPAPYDCPEAWSAEDVRNWADATVGFVQRCAGEKAVIASACLHTDERSPHLHVVLIPITEEGYLSWNKVQYGFAADPVVRKKRISRKLASSAQDRYYDEVAGHFGLGRGEIGSKRRHEPINREVGLVDRILDARKRWEHRQVAGAAQLRADGAERNLVAEFGRRVEAEGALERERLDRPTAVEAVAKAKSFEEIAQTALDERRAAQAERDQAVAERNRVVEEREQLVEERDRAVADHEKAVRTVTDFKAWNDTFVVRMTASFREARLKFEQQLEQARQQLEQARRVPEVAQLHALGQERDQLVVERDALVNDKTSIREDLAVAQQRGRDVDRLVAQARKEGHAAGALSRDPDVMAAKDRATEAEREVVKVRDEAVRAIAAAREAGRKEDLVAHNAQIDVFRAESSKAQKQILGLQADVDAAKLEHEAAVKTERETARTAVAAATTELEAVKTELETVTSDLARVKGSFEAWKADVLVSGPGGGAATTARRSTTRAPGRDDRAARTVPE